MSPRIPRGVSASTLNTGGGLNKNGVVSEDNLTLKTATEDRPSRQPLRDQPPQEENKHRRQPQRIISLKAAANQTT